MKIKNLLAVTLATASTASLALGSSFTLTHGPAAFFLGLAGFYALSLIAGQLNPNI
jgi:hypothetical protein